MAKKIDVPQTTSIKKKIEGWSHYLEAEDPETPTPPVSSPPVGEPSHSTPVETLPRSIAPTIPFEKARTAVVLQKQEELPQRPVPVPPPTPTPISPPAPRPVPPPVVPTAPVSPVRSAAPIKPVRQPRQVPSNFMRNALWSSVAVAGAGLGIFAALMITQKFSEPQPPEIVAVTVPSFLDTDAVISVPLPATRTELWDTLRTEIQKTAGQITHIYPITTTETGPVPATTQEIMGVLSLHTDGSFIRSLEEYSMFGAVETLKQEPYIILQTSNFDTAFAGMLKWERDMSSDLSPLFGSPVLRTLPPSGSAASTNPHFIDALTSDHIIRTLYDETGRERIVYTFVRKDLIIITTSTEALAALIEHVK